jgi:hypothetical protein
LSDPRQDVELTVGDTTYLLRFTHSALVQAEKLTGENIQQLALKLFARQFGFAEIAALTCAGLEGARRKLRLGGQPWTAQKVSDLLDDADDFDQIAGPVSDAFEAALRRWFPAEQEPADPPPTAAGTGTTSSEPPSEQG